MKTLAEIRKSKKIKQKDIAKYLSVSASTISDWERGKSSPSPEMLKKLADFFGVTVDELLGRSSDPQLFDDARVERPEILDLFDQLTPEQQENLLNYARGMATSNELLKGEQSSKKSEIA